jgi:acetoin utilization deacetylase AcuC-like enzyme
MKQMSDLDIEINEGCRDEEYLQQLYDHLPALFELLRPQLVFFQAGIDIHQYDRLGKLNITRHGIIERNRFVYQLIQQYHSNVVVTMGGG